MARLSKSPLAPRRRRESFQVPRMYADNIPNTVDYLANANLLTAIRVRAIVTDPIPTAISRARAIVADPIATAISGCRAHWPYFRGCSPGRFGRSWPYRIFNAVRSPRLRSTGWHDVATILPAGGELLRGDDQWQWWVCLVRGWTCRGCPTLFAALPPFPLWHPVICPLEERRTWPNPP
jgi:hypothetical protein